MVIVQKKELSFDPLCIRTYRWCGYVGGCLSNIQSIEFFGNSSRYFLGLNANAPRSFYFRLQTTLYLVAVPSPPFFPPSPSAAALPSSCIEYHAGSKGRFGNAPSNFSFPELAETTGVKGLLRELPGGDRIWIG